MTCTVDPEIMEKVEQYREMMKGRSSQVAWGWNLFDLPNNLELAHFFASLNKEQMHRFEKDVFVNGHDPKTYIRIHSMVESKATITLSKEIENKATILVAAPNRGGVEGHDGETASTSSGFRDGYHPCMDHPDYAQAVFNGDNPKEEKPKEQPKAKTPKRK